MKKVIYVDIEDDITSIIAKVKEAEAKIIALVPPKRIGVLQSIVNLKLLSRAAQSANKRIVLITNNQALTALAADVAIPVAKNLQSKPEVPTKASQDDSDEEVIRGDEIAVGDHARLASEEAPSTAKNSGDAALSAVMASEQTQAAKAAARAPRKSTAKTRVPNFDAFRKKTFLLGGLGVLLIGVLVWAVFFAPRATVEVAAKTDPTNINRILTLSPGGQLDTSQAVLPLMAEQVKKTQSTEVTATGKKQVGKKATGTVEFTKSSPGSETVPSGTELTSSSGLVFVTDSAVTVPGAELSWDSPGLIDPGTASVGVTAAEPGEKYNGASGNLSGAPSGVSANFADATSGGTDKVATVVSDADVARAREDLKKQDIEAIRKELADRFEEGAIIIQESLTTKSGNPSVSPGVGEEAAKAQLAVETTYTISAIKRNDIKAVFDEYLKTQMSDENSQKIYASGDGNIQFSEYEQDGDRARVRAQATGYIGPQINEEALKPQLTGLRAGEVREIVESVEGVRDVQIHFWPFWVTKVPDPEKTTIKFVVENDQS